MEENTIKIIGAVIVAILGLSLIVHFMIVHSETCPKHRKANVSEFIAAGHEVKR